MIYVFEGGSVVYNGDVLTEAEKSKAVAVQTLPDPEVIEGKIPVLVANLEDQSIHYEYLDAPKQEFDVEAAIIAIQEENAEILFRLAMQEMGGQ